MQLTGRATPPSTQQCSMAMWTWCRSACWSTKSPASSQEMLEQEGVELDRPNHQGLSPLHLAAAATHSESCLQLLLREGAKVDTWLESTPLMAVCR